MSVFPDFLPSEFGVLLLSLSLILTVSPYVAGHDFGPIKIPDFDLDTKRVLRVVGPLALIVSIGLHMPFLQKPCTEPVYETITDAKKCGTIDEQYEVSAASPKTCRNQSFGVERWANVEKTSGNSGWMGGGQSQPDWCSSLISGFIKGRGIGAQHTSRTVSSKEDGRWHGGTFNRRREYNYWCEVEVKWNPVYNARADAAVCGTNPAVMGTRKLPATCDVVVGTREVPCGA